jgi:GMP synthase (glutamine-hydrolysing)
LESQTTEAGAPGRAPAPTSVEEVLVLDFGGQYSQLIARRVRECGVFSELLPATTSVEAIRERAPKALILSGGPASVYEPGAPPFPKDLLDLEIPMLGICYGMQAMVQALGGRVEGAEAGEFGRAEIVLRDGGGKLLGGLPEEQSCWMSHRDAVFEPPPASRRSPPAPGRRWPPPRRPTAASTASSSTRRSSTPPTGPRS